MLKRAPSLALRASLVFMSVYAAIFLAVIMTSAVASLLDRGEGNQRGAVMAIDYAAADLRKVDGDWRLARDGRFADLAARNPSSWLVVLDQGRAFSAGAVDSPTLQEVTHYRGIVERALFRVPRPGDALGSVGAVERRQVGPTTVLIATGGIDPATLSAAESMHLLLEPGVAAMLIVIAVISLLAMLVAAPFFVRALKPITQEAAAIGPQDPGRRLQEGRSPKELLPLVRGFNAALDRLEVELGRRKRFIADAAHELRTPLAVLSLRVESLEDEAGKEDLKRSLARLTHLVSQMLDLERLSLSSPAMASVDLVEVARDLVADLAPTAIGRGYDLALEAPDTPVLVTGEPHAISRALTNLITNAVVHGGGAGRIIVAVDPEGTIDVIDEGPGVAADLLPRLFEPFSRGDPSVEGCGLGLHLTREIMRAHGGDVWLVPSWQGAKFRLRFAHVKP
jgi:signal transduction histidine kinase